MVSDFYAAYDHYPGLKQRCWAHSQQGADTKMALASLFGAWRAQGLNPRTACRQLLASSQL